MKKQLILSMLEALIALLSEDMLKDWLDAGLDWIEDTVAETDTPYDDALIPLVGLIRKALSIPDNDED